MLFTYDGGNAVSVMLGNGDGTCFSSGTAAGAKARNLTPDFP
jgi:hypothetical protein